MRFEDALVAMREGKKAKNKYAYFIIKDGTIKQSSVFNGNFIEAESYLWVSDILSEDWEIVDDTNWDVEYIFSNG